MESAEISHCVAWMESPADLELCVLELSLHLLLRFLDCRSTLLLRIFRLIMDLTYIKFLRNNYIMSY
uniref:Predicted protein n=1 Tax=Hordeum vulgare subsp. vulgare TaxID=112509 RepID=F2DA82_HORVV|nr:predicted protein [Hordeum vulgare subsp. vulgare]